MKIKRRHYLFPGLAILLVLLLTTGLACATEEPPADEERAPSARPPAPADGRRANPQVPTVSLATAEEFAAEQQAVNADWDTLHADFDQWRAGLTACDPSAMQEALREFASDFGEIVSVTYDLPVSTLTKDLSRYVIDAATFEERALRELRDGWQPGDTLLLNNVQEQRNNSASLLRDAANQLDELAEMDDPEKREAAEDFIEAFDSLEAAWQDFHDEYEQVRDSRKELALPDLVSRLKELSDIFDSTVIPALEALPEDDATEELADQLKERADEEGDQLGSLLDAHRDLMAPPEIPAEVGEAVEEAEEAAASAEQEAAEMEQGQAQEGEAGQENGGENGQNGEGDQPPDPETPPEPTPAPPPEPEPPDTEATEEFYLAMDQQVEESEAVLEQVGKDLKTMAEGIGETDREALAEFNSAFDRLLSQWDDFHEGYDQWLRTEGDCERADVANALGQFAARYNQLAAQVQGLSQATDLRPTSDLLNEAVARETAALRTLRNTWAPFRNDVYRGFDRERTEAGQLRREADRRTQEVLERLGGGG